jgi:hypothetical protein
MIRQPVCCCCSVRALQSTSCMVTGNNDPRQLPASCRADRGCVGSRRRGIHQSGGWRGTAVPAGCWRSPSHGKRIVISEGRFVVVQGAAEVQQQERRIGGCTWPHDVWPAGCSERLAIGRLHVGERPQCWLACMGERCCSRSPELKRRIRPLLLPPAPAGRLPCASASPSASDGYHRGASLYSTRGAHRISCVAIPICSLPPRRRRPRAARLPVSPGFARPGARRQRTVALVSLHTPPSALPSVPRARPSRPYVTRTRQATTTLRPLHASTKTASGLSTVAEAPAPPTARL